MIAILLFALGAAIIYLSYRSSQSSAPVHLDDQVEVPPGGLTAVEYFWRPG